MIFVSSKFSNLFVAFSHSIIVRVFADFLDFEGTTDRQTCWDHPTKYKKLDFFFFCGGASTGNSTKSQHFTEVQSKRMYKT